MSEEELSIPVSVTTVSTSLMRSTDIELPTDDQVTLKECCRERCKPLCQVRRVKSKGAILVIIWTLVEASVLTYIINNSNSIINSSQQSSKWMLIIATLIAMGITFPLAGLLADVCFGRYKLISFSLWIMWISLLLQTGALVVLKFQNFKFKNALLIALTIPLGIGLEGFQANNIQFGIDQLIDSSVTEYKSFVSWLVFAFIAGQGVSSYMIQCVEYQLLSQLLVCCGLTLAITLKFLFSHVLIKEPTSQNPFKLIYRVLSYAIKHKYPRQRSAFTYCEDEIPSRIDFGKSKYGGPFTTEQVEDVKSLFRIILLFLTICVACSVSVGENLNDLRSNFYCKSPIHFSLCECSLKFIFNGLYFISFTLIPLHELIFRPLCGKLLPTLKSHHKIMLGILFSVSRTLVLLVMITHSRQKYLSMNTNTNDTSLMCLFHESSEMLSSCIDYKWSAIPEFLHAVSDMMIFVGTIEFLCAQVPYSMKSLVVGFIYLSLGLSLLMIFAIQIIFEFKTINWDTRVMSCGFWYFITKLSLQLVSIIIVGITMKWYKERKREDVLPNDHMFAERYYSR